MMIGGTHSDTLGYKLYDIGYDVNGNRRHVISWFSFQKRKSDLY